MTQYYSIYSAQEGAANTPQRAQMIEHYCNKQPVYTSAHGAHFLFPATYAQITGEAHPHSLDISGITLTAQPQRAQEMHWADFDRQIDHLLGQEASGREVIVSRQQVDYLYHSRYATADEEDNA